MLTDSLIFFFFFLSNFRFGTNDRKKMIGLQLCLAELWQLSIVPPLWDVHRRLRVDLTSTTFLTFPTLMGSILLCVVCGTVITVVSMKVPAGSKSLSCINKGCFVRVLLAVMCLSGNSCLMAARVSLVGSRMKECRQTGLYFNIASFYGHRAESYIDLNLIMILLALIKFVYFQRFRLHTETEKEGKENKLVWGWIVLHVI